MDAAGEIRSRIPQPTRHGWDGIQPTTVRQQLLAGHFSGWLVGESKRCSFLTDMENDDIVQWWTMRSQCFPVNRDNTGTAEGVRHRGEACWSIRGPS
jgi:hypothetical protein